MEKLIIILLFIFFSAIAIYVFIKSPKENKKINSLEDNEIEIEIDEVKTEYLIKLRKEIIPELINKNRELILNILEPYKEKLALKKQQLIYSDFYGDIILENWYKERSNFIENKMWQIKNELLEKAEEKFIDLDLATNEKDFNIKFVFQTQVIKSDFEKNIHESIIEIIENIIIKNNKKYETEITDPISYEKYVSNLFRLKGWETIETKSSGDQGADVIANKLQFKIIIQCKLYSKPVGNKAVQEVLSAKFFYNGNLGIVVSNNSFTKSARQLADSAGIILKHHSEIELYLENLSI